MKIILLIFFCVNFLLPGLTQDIFKELKGEHFIVNYYPGHISFAQKVLTHAEQYYVTIANDLGYSRYSKFWLWNNRVTIYIYPDHASYLKAAHMPSWSNGMADYKNKIIKSYFRGKGFLISILPHEITHLIFRDFVGFTGKIPLWLDEGLAQWEEPLKRKRIKYSMRDIFKRKMILPLSEMMKMDIRNIKSDNKISIRYINDKGKTLVSIISGNNLVSLYYQEAVSLVGFLIKKYGNRRFTVFCRDLRDGNSVEESLRDAYSEYFTKLDDLEKAWRNYYK